MPGMDGYETARLIRMRNESEHTPIIFITAHAAEEAKIPIAYASGAVDFIFAPIVPDILRAKVRIFVELFLKSRGARRRDRRRQFRDSEARTRSVLDNVADGIVTVGEDGVIESFNRAACRAVRLQRAGGDRPAVLDDGRRRSTPVTSPTRAEADQQLLSPQPRGGRAVEPVGRRKDGSTFPMELDLSDVELETGTIHIGCLRDISERQTLHRGAPAPGAARRPHRPSQPRAVRGPRRRTRSGRRCGPATRSRCWSWTSTTSSTSTTRSGTSTATRC